MLIGRIVERNWCDQSVEIGRKPLIWVASALALAIFSIDFFSRLEGAIAVLYIAVVLLVAPLGRRFVLISGIGTAVLTTIAFAAGHFVGLSEGAIFRYGVSLIAVAITTVLSLRDRSTRTTLSEQARILELSHDTVIIRDSDDVILYWNDGAEQLYGWTRREAIGRRCQTLLRCDFPEPEIKADLNRCGQWSGEITRVRRDGTRLVLASRWLLRRDPEGRTIGMIESSADLTDQRRANAERLASEERFRTMFETAGFATWVSDWSQTLRMAMDGCGEPDKLEDWLLARPELIKDAIRKAVIRNANVEAASLFQAPSPSNLIGANLCGRYLPDGMRAFAHILTKLAGGADCVESETRLVTLEGRVVDVVLRVTLLPEGERWSNMLVMAFDVTERNEARARLEQTMAELAHAGRVSILGQLAASIAHEVNQPLTAIINYGKSAKRWLSRPEPEIDELTECLERIVASGVRAAEVISRVRSLARKEVPRSEPLNVSELVEDALNLFQREARAADVVLRYVELEADLPPVMGDRVQIQQVLANLLMNGVQAMRGPAWESRELTVATELTSDGAVRVSVRDHGPGFAVDAIDRVFEPFYTTKSDGMGMGLSICRSIVEAQGGQMMASNNGGAGATVAFTLPTAQGAAVEARLVRPNTAGILAHRRSQDRDFSSSPVCS